MNLPLTRKPGTQKDTVTWERVPNAMGFRFTVLGKFSHSWDGAKTFTTVPKGQPIDVEALGLLAAGHDPPVAPPPPPPVGWVIEPPRSPFQTIPARIGLGINVTSTTQVHDVVTTSSTDTSVLFQPGAPGSSLRRAVLNGVGRPQQSVTYGLHGVYGKARDLTIEDVVAKCGPDAESGFSLRYDGAVLRRFDVQGSPAHPVTYYETSDVAGLVAVEHGTATYSHGQTAIWCALDSKPRVLQDFLFRDVHVTGPSGALFARFAPGLMDGDVRVDSCTINGRPVTAADVEAPRKIVT